MTSIPFEPPNPDYATIVPKMVLSMPAAALLGFSFREIGPGRVDLLLPFRRELGEHQGFFQGGVIGMLLDFAGGAASGTMLREGHMLMTLDYTVKLLAPARGGALSARGRVIDASHSIGVSAVDVFAESPERSALVATGLVSIRSFPLPVRPTRTGAVTAPG